MRQLTIGSQYVEQTYGVMPICFYVLGQPDAFHVLKSDSGVGTFEPLDKNRSNGLARRINRQFPIFAHRLPQNVLFYGYD